MYLGCICEEAQARGYSFDRSKVGRWTECDRIEEARGQAEYEWEYLRAKLKRRSPARVALVRTVRRPYSHPLFIVIGGEVRDWERVTPARPRPKAATRPARRPRDATLR
jgi:hypothetical protein